MAPLHDWKDDAEFIRYNRPEAARPVISDRAVATIICLLATPVLFGLVVLTMLLIDAVNVAANAL